MTTAGYGELQTALVVDCAGAGLTSTIRGPAAAALPAGTDPRAKNLDCSVGTNARSRRQATPDQH